MTTVGHYLELMELADKYADACVKVEPAWQEVLKTPVCGHGFRPTKLPVTAEPPCCERRVAMKVYFEAGKVARDLREALLKCASRGAMEVGVG